MRAAHANGELLHFLTHWLPDWQFKQDRFTARMVEIMDCGLPVWEEIVAATGEPWSPFVTMSSAAPCWRSWHAFARTVDADHRRR